MNEGLAGSTGDGKEYPAHPKILYILILIKEEIATMETPERKDVKTTISQLKSTDIDAVDELMK